jgi:hypothetical protein
MGEVARPLVDRIIAAKKTFAEGDRPWLSALADGQLEKIAASCGCTAAEDTSETPAVAPPAAATAVAASAASAGAPAGVVDPAPAAEPVVPKTEDEWLALAPTPETREMYAEMRAAFDTETQRLCSEIIANKANPFTEAELKTKPRADLKKIHSLAAKPAADFSGRGVAAHDATDRTQTSKSPPMPGMEIGAA